MKQHNQESKNLKAPIEGAIIRYAVTYNGGLAKYPKSKSGEIGLNILEDCFYLKPTMTTIEWFEEMAIPYKKIRKVEIVERTISNTEWLLSSSRSDMKAMEQKNNIEISYLDGEDKNQLIRLEMLTGVSIYGLENVLSLWIFSDKMKFLKNLLKKRVRAMMKTPKMIF